MTEHVGTIVARQTHDTVSNHRARYYEAKIGRFLSEDSIGFRGWTDFYTYVSNSPANFVDPFGLQQAPKPPASKSTPGWWENFKNGLKECWNNPFQCGAKPGSFGPGPDAAARGLCDSKKYLFGEASPVNPYYKKDPMTGRTDPDTDAALSAWKNSFNAKCSGGNKVPICGWSVLGPAGPQFICACCETCDQNDKKDGKK